MHITEYHPGKYKTNSNLPLFSSLARVFATLDIFHGSTNSRLAHLLLSCTVKPVIMGHSDERMPFDHSTFHIKWCTTSVPVYIFPTLWNQLVRDTGLLINEVSLKTGLTVYMCLVIQHIYQEKHCFFELITLHLKTTNTS